MEPARKSIKSSKKRLEPSVKKENATKSSTSRKPKSIFGKKSLSPVKSKNVQQITKLKMIDPMEELKEQYGDKEANWFTEFDFVAKPKKEEPLHELIPYCRKNDENYKKMVIHLLMGPAFKRRNKSVRQFIRKTCSPVKKAFNTKKKSISIRKSAKRMHKLFDKNRKEHCFYVYGEEQIGFDAKWQQKVQVMVKF